MFFEQLRALAAVQFEAHQRGKRVPGQRGDARPNVLLQDRVSRTRNSFPVAIGAGRPVDSRQAAGIADQPHDLLSARRALAPDDALETGAAASLAGRATLNVMIRKNGSTSTSGGALSSPQPQT